MRMIWMKDEQVRLVSGQVRSDIKVRSVVRGGTGPLEREKLGAFGIVVCDMEKKSSGSETRTAGQRRGVARNKATRGVG